MNQRALILTGLSLILSLPLAKAEAQSRPRPDPAIWGLCAPDPLAAEITPDTGAPEDSPIDFTADTAEASSLEAMLEGSVEVRRGDQRLRAPLVTLDRTNNLLHAEQGVIYGDPQLAVRSRAGDVDLNNRVGRFDSAEYYFMERNAQGSASRVEIDYNRQRSHLEQVTFSTCERGREFWQIRSADLRVDHAKGRATARNMTFAIKNVPVLWLPWISFPIDDQRHSGLLSPQARFDSDSGLDLALPWYWNIAPNQDATFTPRILTERGLMLGAQYRFLRPRHRGEIAFEYLPDDQEFGDDRGSLFLRHQATPFEGVRFHTDLLYQEVSDQDYLDDFGNRLDLLSTTSLERHLDSIYYAGHWSFRARIQDFQTVDNEIFPPDDPDAELYSRLPQFQFNGAWPDRLLGFNYQFYGELVYFDHDSRVTGLRADLMPTLSLPLEWTAGFVEPRLSYRYTAYRLQDNLAPGQADAPDRGAPVLSIDSGLFFERPVSFGDWSGIQTLEPRLFYLYVPFRDQDDIPVFDSTEIDRSYPWLFLENRFTGADRLGDANQLTTALTTRLLESGQGREQLRVSVGQIQFFEDRRVTLDAAENIENESNRSVVIGELAATLPKGLSLRGTLQWEADDSDTRRSSLDLGYRPRQGRLFNISHRYRQGELEQVDLSMLWTFNDRWRAVARWNRALREDRTLDAFLGVEYGECCWTLRALVRRHRDEPDDLDPRNSVALQLELKGLGGVGSSVDKLLEDAIFGYQRTRY